ncbi:macro domain-containing protein [Blastopirellula sp. JC732]|uniref:Macro domain-containing protein n=1 Tax=Blastopirellula sediminis TaxID=2894196 RepID=A0A9X1MLH8_9BACT|nr:macro domain-containing protein [Blastopirellula sediminis]MCC9607344.1 macro domain-containing protein [Blastopirellula sediminis]MCC9629363.1 macro domain-containing protein [Blastopirellula sediminis]
MERRWGNQRIELTIGDITEQNVDILVNAANSRLAGGGGVDGAIHAAGGPSIMEETRHRYPHGCPTGSAVISSAGNLSARYVIHAVGPIWQGGHAHEEKELESAYKRCFELAATHDATSIALPALSCGAYGYPLDLAAEIALKTSILWFKFHTQPRLIRFVLYSEGPYSVFADVLEELTGPSGKPHKETEDDDV